MCGIPENDDDDSEDFFTDVGRQVAEFIAPQQPLPASPPQPGNDDGGRADPPLPPAQSTSVVAASRKFNVVPVAGPSPQPSHAPIGASHSSPSSKRKKGRNRGGLQPPPLKISPALPPLPTPPTGNDPHGYVSIWGHKVRADHVGMGIVGSGTVVGFLAIRRLVGALRRNAISVPS